MDSVPKVILGAITLFIMVCGFASAWFYMVKKTILLSKKIFVFDKDRAKELLNLAMSLPKGIGRLFLPMCGVVSIYLILYLSTFTITGFIITKIIGEVDFQTLVQSLGQLISSSEVINQFQDFSENEIYTIELFYIISTICHIIITFLTMLWIPEIVYSKKNAFKALGLSICKIFTNFPKSLLLYSYITILAVLITILNTILMFNPILYFIVLIFYYYFIIYLIVLLFSYYEQNFS